jgi:hypothetical protein
MTREGAVERERAAVADPLAVDLLREIPPRNTICIVRLQRYRRTPRTGEDRGILDPPVKEVAEGVVARAGRRSGVGAKDNLVKRSERAGEIRFAGVGDAPTPLQRGLP